MYRGFDERQGIDVAWSKIEAERNHLTHEKRKQIVEELSLGIEFDHPNVIKVRPPGTRPRTSLRACVSTARHEQPHHHAMLPLPDPNPPPRQSNFLPEAHLILQSYQCWENEVDGCINTVTEYFTSGNLREYRKRHKTLDMRALKKWARQILHGLSYLHHRVPPIVHGDLR